MITTPYRILMGGAALATVACLAASPIEAQRAPAERVAPVPKGFVSLFDGRTLNGWRGDPAVWSVRDGAITSSSDKGLSHNTFLILNRPYANFEIRLKYRFVTRVGNSGLQFRSGQVEGNHVLAGMQSNITPANFSACGLPSCGEERFGMLYEELNRLEMVLLGERAVITRRQATTGGQGAIVRTVLGTTNPREAIIASIKPYPQWNEDVLIVHGNRIVHVINGLVAFDATDNDPLGAKDGLIGLQAHAGPPSTAQFKDLVIRPLTSFPDISRRFVTKPGPAPEPVRTQLNIKLEKAASN
ncbi:3-keto-disaccharide hydrolase [Sphingomonas colocasiae]|uniref:DUF1080 domain-containing protein n=1 Tax=Sphingomonas colocasiae TaxID=1848973 RepID=A0ABS7PHH2_9SPHN|nr:DUF1080 domain-containing protein [Sphingomonas colocasiae]MBY8820752.1 DUF1080 domain-containing protein [Sphingomonas colocasiae]